MEGEEQGRQSNADGRETGKKDRWRLRPGKPGSTPIRHELQDDHYSLRCNRAGGSLNSDDSDYLTHSRDDFL
jgi:hypothetical protein